MALISFCKGYLTINKVVIDRFVFIAFQNPWESDLEGSATY